MTELSSQQQVEEFHAAWCKPVYDALITMQLDLARDLIGLARRAVLASTLADDAREVCHYQVEFLYYNYANLDEVLGWNAERYELTLAAFSAPAKTALGEKQRVKQVFKVRYHADADGIAPLSRTEVDGFLKELDLGFNSDAWFNLEGWAFKHCQLDLIVRAFEHHLTNPHPIMGHARWQRVNLMHLLLSGRAEPRDVEESIKTLSIKPQLQDFATLLWPRCEAAGLVDDKLRSALKKRSEQILRDKPRPYREQRTKAIRMKA